MPFHIGPEFPQDLESPVKMQSDRIDAVGVIPGHHRYAQLLRLLQDRLGRIRFEGPLFNGANIHLHDRFQGAHEFQIAPHPVLNGRQSKGGRVGRIEDPNQVEVPDNLRPDRREQLMLGIEIPAVKRLETTGRGNGLGVAIG